MQNNAIERIKSGPKGRLVLWTIVILIVGAALYLSFSSSRNNSNATLSVPNSSNKYALQIANTPELRSKGLGGTESLPDDQGMLFIFPQPNHACFWMKDMKYSLDMIWLDADKKVVNVAANVHPSTYPDQTFCSRAKKASYVVELNAGEIEHAHIGLGQTLKF